MDAYAAQWIGHRRKQEDAYAVRHFPDGTLAVVCDGMGGHSAGDLASGVAAARFADAFAESAATPLSIPARLRAALETANAEVGELFATQGAFGGTTLLALYAGKGCFYWLSVGDSMLWLWRSGRLKRLNEDHSMRSVYARYVCAGGMTRREAMDNGHVLRSAVTGEPVPMVDAPAAPHPLLPGDRLILCSDGAEPLLDAEVLPCSLRCLLDDRSAPLAAALVEACRNLREEYSDNVTVVTLDAPSICH